MNKVITIHLNGRAYQLEETGYEAIQNYLRDAEAKLSVDPDKIEIMKDLEQALSEKMDRFLNAHKTVVSEQEISEIIKEMGPVQSPHSETAGKDTSKNSSSTAKRLYKIRQGALFRGVCMGLAAYFDIDVTLVRIVFVGLAVLTHGAWVLVYFILMLVIPEAETSEQTAQAYGHPFTAQELINRGRQEYQKFASSGQWHQWKSEWKHKIKEEARYYSQQQAMKYKSQRQHFSPVYGLIMAGISLLWVLGIVQLVSSGTIFGIIIPNSIPLWIAILGWLIVYSFIMRPIRMSLMHYNNAAGEDHHYGDFLEALSWLAFFVIIGWVVWQYIPGSHLFFEKIYGWIHSLLIKLKIVRH